MSCAAGISIDPAHKRNTTVIVVLTESSPPAKGKLAMVGKGMSNEGHCPVVAAQVKDRASMTTTMTTKAPVVVARQIGRTVANRKLGVRVQ